MAGSHSSPPAPGRDPCRGLVVLRPHGPLFPEGGTDKVKPAPTARAACLRDRFGFVLRILGLVDAGIVGPLRVDPAAGALEFTL